MAHPSSFERDFDRLQRLSVDLSRGLEAAEAVLLDHSRAEARLAPINFPLAEGMFDEAIALLGSWKALAAKLIRDVDVAASLQKLSFERLFDKHAGPEQTGFFRRRAPLRKVAPEAISTVLSSLLIALGRLGAMLQETVPALGRHHRQCEYHLLQLVERRQTVDFSIDAVSREIIDLKARLRRHQSSVASARTAAALADSEQERKIIDAEQKSAAASEEALSSERETLARLIDDVDGFVDALNGQMAATQVMLAKASTDAEQAIALIKAVLQSGPSSSEIPTPVAAMIAAYDANPLSGLGLFERKRNADAAFSRRLDAVVPAAQIPADADDVEGEVPAEDEQAAEITR